MAVVYPPEREITMEEKVKRTPAPLNAMVEEFNFEILHKGENYDKLVITVANINRPALQLVGYYDDFDPKRLQILGNVEMNFLARMNIDERRQIFNRLFSYNIPAVVVARNLDIGPEMLEMAEKHGRTLLRTPMETVEAIARMNDYLNRALAPQITRHGVLMNVYGQGVFLIGDSGIGKSETALELLKRGHRLIADDAVDIRCISDGLHGSAPETIRHYIEIRGIGIIDVQQLFGMGAVQFESEVELVIQLEPWVDCKFYDRLGLGGETYEILGVKVPLVTIPVRPGRNLAGIVEIAAMKNRQMKYSNNPALDFITQFDQHVDSLPAED